MDVFAREMARLDGALTGAGMEETRQRVWRELAGGKVEVFLLRGYPLGEGRGRLVWDWRREAVLLDDPGDGRRPLPAAAAGAERRLGREVRLVLASFFVG